MSEQRNYSPYTTIMYGGFGETHIIPVSRKPIEVTKVSDNEVYAVYSDIDNVKIRYKQVWTAEGSGSTRTNPKQKIYITKDSGKTWTLMYSG